MRSKKKVNKNEGNYEGNLKNDSIRLRRNFYKRVSSKVPYLNPEIVEEVWGCMLKVIADDLKRDGVSFLPNLLRIKANRKISKGGQKGFINLAPAGEEYLSLTVRINSKIRLYFSKYLKNQKELSNLVPESPATLIK